MMKYETKQIDVGIKMKEDLDAEIQAYSAEGWTYIGAIDNDAMGTVILVFERKG